MGSFQDYLDIKMEEGVTDVRSLRGRVPSGFQVRSPEEELAGPTDMPPSIGNRQQYIKPKTPKPQAQGYSTDKEKFNFKQPTASFSHAETGLARLRGIKRTPQFTQTINLVNNMDDEEKFAIFKLLQKQFT